MKFRIKDFFSKCEQIRSFLFIRSHLLKKSLMEDNAVKAQFCAVCCLKEVSKKTICWSQIWKDPEEFAKNPVWRLYGGDSHLESRVLL